MNTFNIYPGLQPKLLVITIGYLVTCMFVYGSANAQSSTPRTKNDSLKYDFGYVSFGFGTGRKSLDVSTLNQSLTRSKLNKVDDVMSFVDFDFSLSLGKGIILGGNYQYYFDIQSTTKDKDGTFNSTLSWEDLPSEINLNLSTIVFKNEKVMVIPKFGLSVTSLSTKITLDRKGSIVPFKPNTLYQEKSIRDVLLASKDGVLEGRTGSANITVELNMYFKIADLGWYDEEAWDDTRPSWQVFRHSMLWLCPFVNYNFPLQSLETNEISNFPGYHPQAKTGYIASGLNYGVRLMYTAEFKSNLP